MFLDVSDENLDNLANNSMSFDLVIEVDGDRDKVSMAGTVTLVKPVPVETGPDVEQTAWWAGNILFLLIGIGVFAGVIVVSVRIFRSASAPMEEMSSLTDYEMTVDGSGWDDSPGIPQAPSLPSDDEVANSMYGGAKEIFEQPPEMPPPPMPGAGRGSAAPRGRHTTRRANRAAGRSE